MESRAEIQLLATQKLVAAKCLLDNGFYADAYYLAGYSIELFLKAVICKTLGAEDFYSSDKKNNREIHRVFKSHVFADLLFLSGKETEFLTYAEQEPDLEKSWKIVKCWNESSRYASYQNPFTVKEFIHSSNTVCKWIQKLL